MELRAALWSGLPPEIMEHVLCFLPVPDLCRYRSVCKTWNRLIDNPNFAAVHAHSAAKRHDAASFIVMSSSHRFKDRQTSRKMPSSWCILDLNARRWYKISHNNLYQFKRDCDIMAMDGGLVCQYLESKSQANTIIVHNPVASMSTAKVLPTAPDHLTSQSFPELSLAVDSTTASHSFKIVLINHSFNDRDLLEDPGRLHPETCTLIQNDPFVRVYYSATDEWKSMGNPAWIFHRGVGHIRRSIMFQGFLYVLFYGEKEYQLWRYALGENVWEHVAVNISSDFKYPELIVTASRFFLVGWYGKRFCLGLDGGLKNQKERKWFYKLFEIKVPAMKRETLFDHSKAKIETLFECYSEPRYPQMSVFGFGSALLFMSNSSGKTISFDVGTRKWDHEWPQNPLGCLPDCSWVGEHMNLLLPSTTLW